MGVVGDALDEVAHLGGHLLGQVVAEVVLQDVGDAPLAGLAVDADDVGLVLPVDVVGVQGEVGDGPVFLLPLFPEVHPLGDGVLVGAGEGGKHQVAGVGLAVPHGHAGQALIALHDLGHVGEVQLGSTPWVKRFMAMVMMSTLPVRSPLPKRVPSIRWPRPAGPVPRRPRRCPGRCGGWMETMTFSRVMEVLAHVLNLLGIDMGHGHLHGGGEVDDHLPLRPGASTRR